MNYYVINRGTGLVTYFNGSVRLQPKGQKGDARRLPGWASTHQEITELKAKKKVLLLTEEEYRDYLAGNYPSKKAQKPVTPPAPEPEVAPEPEPEPEPEVVPEPEPEPEPEVVPEPEPVGDPMSLTDFKAMKKDEQLDELKRLGIFQEDHETKKSVAEDAYEAYLSTSS